MEAVMQSNVVQAEFFHVHGETLEEVATECVARIADAVQLWRKGIHASAGIKTTVRFFDATGRITAYALRADQLEKQFTLFATKADDAAGMWRRFLLWRSRTALKKALALQKKIKRLVTIQLCKALRAKEPVVIEANNFDLRLVRDDEVYELISAVQKAKNVWIFVWKPNELTAQTNELVTDAIF